MQSNRPNPATGVDENGYLQLQPSDAYIVSLQANTTVAITEPSSPAASKQHHQTQDDP